MKYFGKEIRHNPLVVTGSTVTAIAVRFWIGTKDAMGSVKAKADIENPAEPNRWHTHADVPNPIPSDEPTGRLAHRH